MAELSTFSTTGAIRLFVVRRVMRAVSAFSPRMRSTTSRAFCGETRMYLASALASINSSGVRSQEPGDRIPRDSLLFGILSPDFWLLTSHNHAGFDLVSVAAFTECPLKCRVGENSP